MTDSNNHIHIDDLPEDCRQIAELIGIDALLILSRKMGGDRIHIPHPERLAVAARNRAIREAFNGRNYRELAIRYGLTVRWVRVIVSGEKTDGKDPDDKQGTYKQQKMF